MTFVPFLYYPIISSKMTQSRFEVIMCCLHITNSVNLESDKANALYDKIGKSRWLVKKCMIKFKSSYKL